MTEGVYIILGLVVVVNIAWIAIKVWTRKKDRADRTYRALYRDIWQDTAKPERKRLIQGTMTDFEEPKRKRLTDIARERGWEKLPEDVVKSNMTGVIPSVSIDDDAPTEKLQ